MTLRQARADLRLAADPKKAVFLQSYFKTGPGEYGEGDTFIGVTVPLLRTIAKKHQGLRLPNLSRLLHSRINEERALALAILVLQFHRADNRERQVLFSFYLRHLWYVNNWNLIDGSAPAIIGPILMGRHTALLYQLAKSKRMWDRRIAVVSTLHLIKRGEYEHTLRLCAMLLRDPHDLIHKACGWMLREVGKRSLRSLTRFLRAHHATMPRTMLRYAIERVPERKRRAYLRHHSRRPRFLPK